MPKTVRDKENELIEVPLSSELNFWDFDPHNKAIIYVDGSVGAGFELSGIDNECDSDDEINQKSLLTRGFLNSLPEGISIQVINQIDSDYDDIISSHDKKTKFPLIDWISQNRIRRLYFEQDEGLLYRPRIFLFFRYFPKADVVTKIRFFEKKKKFESRSKNYHFKMMDDLNQLALDIEAALVTIGISCTRLNVYELRALIYDFLNPERAKILPIRN
jgi:hypothetical protein